MSEIIGGTIMLLLFCFIIWGFISQQRRCKWGLHDWMSTTYPFWGGEEQGTYCCDHRVKIVRKYKNGKCISKKRAPFTDEDIAKKEAVFTKRAEGYKQQKFNEKLCRDMLSDDDCEELLP